MERAYEALGLTLRNGEPRLQQFGKTHLVDIYISSHLYHNGRVLSREFFLLLHVPLR